MFSDANWKSLGLKKTRYFIEWNAISQPAESQNRDAAIEPFCIRANPQSSRI